MPGQARHNGHLLSIRRYTIVVRHALPFFLVTTPALAVAPHSGVIHTRSMPELSDIALFVVAVGGVWLVRRTLRRRFPAHKD